MSLVEKAKNAKRKQRGRKSKFPLEERLALALAYINGEVDCSQIREVLGTRGSLQPYLGSILLTAARHKLIKIEKAD